MAQEHETEHDGEQSVLAGLDSSATTSMYWYLALLACIGGFLFGYDTADIGSVLSFIPYKLRPSGPGTSSPVPRWVQRWALWPPDRSRTGSAASRC